ncbi:MAG: hypothetical protein WAU39_18560 [Polyangiales bacterium]
MRYGFSSLICALGIVVFPVVGCSDVAGDGTGGTGGTAGTGGTGGTTGGQTVEITLTIVEGVTGGTARPRVEGVRVCETDTDNCADTDANGEVTIEIPVPDDGRISYTYRKDEYVGVLRTDVVDGLFFPVKTHYIINDADAQVWADLIGTPYPMKETGLATVNVSTGGNALEGATFELVGATGKPYYLDPSGLPDPALTSTTTGREGGFAEVEPGMVEIKIAGSAKDCIPLSGWPGSAPSTVSMPVRVGFVSWTDVACGTATVPLSVTVTEIDNFVPAGGTPLEGAELCETDTTNCDTTDADGLASIMLPANQEVSYTVTKEGYGSYLVADVTDETFSYATFWPMLSDALWEDAFEPLGATPVEGGHILLRVRAGGADPLDNIAGVTYELIGETNQAFYEAVDWTASYELDATTSNGTGGFVELPAGTYQAEFGGVATNCAPQIGWPGNAPHRLRVPVKEGYVTYSSMWCDEP